MDGGVIATATELFEGRHYPGVVAMCCDALDNEPECVPLLLIRARARIALRRELEAQADLRDVIRLDPGCALAHRLLGELAAKRDEHASAARFFREALRLDPDDRTAAEWLVIVDPSLRPAAVAQKLPAPATAAGRFPRAMTPPVYVEPETLDARPARFARGTHGDHEERPTKPFARGASPSDAGREWRTPMPRTAAAPHDKTVDMPEVPTLHGRPASVTPARPAPKLASRPVTRGPTPELPGFGEYLVASGILTRERLRAAQAYQRSMRVQLSTAIVTLGLATPQRIEWAAVAHQSQLARERAG